MILGPRVHIRAPDFDEWLRAFPEGLGHSAFASPGMQRALAELERGDPGHAPWEQRALSIDGSELWLPVLGRRDRFGRWELKVVPTGYDVMPIQRARLREAELNEWMSALCTPRITFFRWWLPSWHTSGMQLASRRGVGGSVAVAAHNTYVIGLDNTAEHHLEKQVSSTMRRYVRRNEKAGVTVVGNPTAEQIDAYFHIYEQSFHDNAWVGEMFPRRFFDVVANELGRGGELAVVLHGDKVVGGGVLVYDRTVVHYFQGAIDRSLKDINPHVALYWYALRCAEARGIRYVNLGGINDGNEGLIRFKTSWGGIETPSPMLTFHSGSRNAFDALRERFLGGRRP